MQKVEHQRNHPACVIDTERIFGYRALRISRNDQTPLPGFDENYYVNNTEATARSIQDLLAEFSAVSFEFAFKSFSEDQQKNGIAQCGCFSSSNRFYYDWTSKHHLNIFQERYL
jgi:hypothetical protein